MELETRLVYADEVSEAVLFDKVANYSELTVTDSVANVPDQYATKEVRLK